MSPSLILILAVVLAYLAARVAFDWLAKRFMLVSGVEYLLLGILLGPRVSGVLSTETMAGFAPLITLALGWIGAIVGTQFYLPALVTIAGARYRLAFLEALGTAFVVAGVETYLIAWLGGMTVRAALVPAVALGAIAAVSAPAGIEVATRRIGAGRREPIVQQLQVATAVDALVGIVAIGLLFSLFHPPTRSGLRAITPTEWAVMTFGIGAVGGALFHLFLGDEMDGDRLFISLAGAIILVTGAAAYLDLSPVLASMIVGTTLINTSRGRQKIAETLAQSERPFYFVLLVFAGASWRPSGVSWWWAPVVLFLVARVTAKIGTARLAARANGELPVLGPDWGRALVGQGGLALALALDYARFRGGTLPNVVFSAAVASLLLTDLASAHVIHSVMSRLLPGLHVRGWERRRRAGAAAEGGGGANGAETAEGAEDGEERIGAAENTGERAGERAGAAGKPAAEPLDPPSEER